MPSIRVYRHSPSAFHSGLRRRICPHPNRLALALRDEPHERDTEEGESGFIEESMPGPARGSSQDCRVRFFR